MNAAKGQRAMDPRVIVALDFADVNRALALVERLDPASCRLKVGKELFTAAGPALVKRLVDRRFGVFLDLKYHDIPNTVASACRAAAALGVWMINVHASGGRGMLQAARDALAHDTQPPLLIAVTVLTSLNAGDLTEIGIAGSPMEAASRLARLAQSCGLDGVVCSAHEALSFRRELGAGFCLVTPGIRLAGAGHDDQQRVMTPRAAIESGADYLVIGRPITLARDPLAVLQDVNGQIGAPI
ncbi:MAG TPA: orotidine-5'-phosphate decarboxylase [Burkholderiales bacterium]|nr:orotidine-5'-phosphate decarboxylase [Burkholderiales bacterium]